MPTDRSLAKQTIETYATTLYEASVSVDAIDAVGAQLGDAARTVTLNAELRDAVLDDTLPAEIRRKIMTGVFAGFEPVLLEALGVMAERGNVDLLGAVEERYTDIAEDRRGLVTVDVTTAVELTERIRTAITEKLTSDFGRGVVLRERIDPSIVGGIVMSAHGRRIDASITSQLESARETLAAPPQTGGEF